MSGLALLIPLALLFGLCGLAAFFWSMRSGQFDDLDTPALDILDDEPPRPKTPAADRGEDAG